MSMRKIFTSADIPMLKKAGVTELVLNDGDFLTDLSRELIQREGIRIVKTYVSAGGGERPLQVNTQDLGPAESLRYDLVIVNGTVMIPEFGAISANLGIRAGKVAAIFTGCMEAEQVIDAKGLLVLPGIIDPHTHMGIFAPMETDLESESRSAILGGVTTIGCFFNQAGSFEAAA